MHQKYAKSIKIVLFVRKFKIKKKFTHFFPQFFPKRQKQLKRGQSDLSFLRSGYQVGNMTASIEI